MPRPTAPWELHDQALQRLLARLDPDPATAGERYEELRRTLVKFFDWRGASAPDECADETIDRLARKLDGGEVIADIKAFAYGIARLVLLEQRREPGANVASLDETARSDVAAPIPDAGHSLMPCLEHCLRELPEDARALILRYYVDAKRAKIDARAALARELEVSTSALRNRAQRIRDRLERCALNCARLRDGAGS